MAQSYNPFDVLELRLNSIENLLLDFKHKYISPPPQQPDQWLDLNEVVKYDPEKRSKPTWYGYIHRREAPFHKRGKKIIFLKSELDYWLKQGRIKTFAETALEAETYLAKKRGGERHEK